MFVIEKAPEAPHVNRKKSVGRGSKNEKLATM
jgi:hypothetical protein